MSHNDNGMGCPYFIVNSYIHLKNTSSSHRVSFIYSIVSTSEHLIARKNRQLLDLGFSLVRGRV